MTTLRAEPEGWMGRGSCRWLVKRARAAKRIIEVGVWQGRTTRMLADATSGTVWAVDHWLGTPDDAGQHELYEGGLDAAYDVFNRHMADHVESGRVVVVRADTVDAAGQLLAEHGAVFDFVFIDADHRYEAVRADIEAYLPLVAPGGLLAGHDYGKWGVADAVDEVLGDGVKLGPGSIWRVRA